MAEYERAPVVQAKLTLGTPGDPFEQEADAMADRVVQRMHADVPRFADAPSVQTKCAECLEKEELQRQADEGDRPHVRLQANAESSINVPRSIEHAPSSVEQTLSTPGTPMPTAVRRDMEDAFARDFSGVRFHADGSAAASAREISAAAYTAGHHVVFAEHRFAPGAVAGRRLLAHELTHVVQQGAAPGLAALVQRQELRAAESSLADQREPFFEAAPRAGFLRRGPFDGVEDPLHQPIIDQYRRETGLRPGEGPSDAMIKYVLAPAYFAPRGVLNRSRHDRPEYVSAVTHWSDSEQVWPNLDSRVAREEFVRYVVSFDLTNCRPYSQGERRMDGSCATFARNAETFDNLCQGYASQFYARFTATGRLPAADVQRLADFGRVYVEQIPAKFHMAIFMATVPGHAFNAILVGSDPRNIDDYLFLEPQNDNLFTAQSPTFRSYVSEGILTIGRLAAFNESGQYVEQTEQSFVQEPTGAFVNQPLTLGQRIALSRLLSAFAIADDVNAWRATIQQAGITLEDHLRREGRLSSDENILFAARFLIGRTFRRSPQARPENITSDIYLDMLGRQDLVARLRQASSTPIPASSGARTQ